MAKIAFSSSQAASPPLYRGHTLTSYQPNPRSHGPRRTPSTSSEDLVEKKARKQVPLPRFSLTPSLILPVLHLMHKGRHWVLVVSTLPLSCSRCSLSNRPSSLPTSSVLVSLSVPPVLTPLPDHQRKFTHLLGRCLRKYHPSLVTQTTLFPRFAVVLRRSPYPQPQLVRVDYISDCYLTSGFPLVIFGYV